MHQDKTTKLLYCTIKMKQTIYAVVLVLTVTIAAGLPLQACNKLKNVREGVDNYDLYLVKLKNSDNYMDAEYVINLVSQNQPTLEQHASDAYSEPLIESRLELSEIAAGTLYGTLSPQALNLVSYTYVIIYSDNLILYLYFNRYVQKAEWNLSFQIIREVSLTRMKVPACTLRLMRLMYIPQTVLS